VSMYNVTWTMIFECAEPDRFVAIQRLLLRRRLRKSYAQLVCNSTTANDAHRKSSGIDGDININNRDARCDHSLYN